MYGSPLALPLLTFAFGVTAVDLHSLCLAPCCSHIQASCLDRRNIEISTLRRMNSTILIHFIQERILVQRIHVAHVLALLSSGKLFDVAQEDFVTHPLEQRKVLQTTRPPAKSLKFEGTFLHKFAQKFPVVVCKDTLLRFSCACCCLNGVTTTISTSATPATSVSR